MTEAALRKDDEMIGAINNLGGKIDSILQSSQETAFSLACHGELMSLFQTIKVAAVEKNSKWLQTAPGFRSLLGTISKISDRERLRNVSVPVCNVEDYIQKFELVRSNTLNLLDDLRNCIESLPPRFKSDSKELMDNLHEQTRRIRELRMSVFMGPAKSGKSTAVNAILGFPVAPSHTLPCTVMPTIFRHSFNNKIPRLLLSEVALVSLNAAVDAIRLNHHSIAPKLVTENERIYFEKIISLPLPIFTKLHYYESFGQQAVNLREALFLMNNMCRIYARAQTGVKPSIDAEDLDYNPMIDLIETGAWPVVEFEFALLKEERNIIGKFEIIDTPGLDEVSLIPAIKDVVLSTISSSAALICVLNTTTAMTDGSENVRVELNNAIRLESPVYLLANRIDCLPTGSSSAYIRDTLLAIGKNFLRNSYDDKLQQVFGVSSLAAFNYAILNKQRIENPEVLNEVVAGLPNHYNEKGKPYVDDYQPKCSYESGLLQSLMNVGGKRWAKSCVDDVDEAITDMKSLSNYDGFLNKLLKELAPQSGQKVLEDNVNIILRHLREIMNNMSRTIEMLLLSNDDFKFEKDSLEGQLAKLETLIFSVIPRDCDNHIKASIEKLRTLKYNAQRKMAEVVTQLVQDLKIRKVAISGYTLQEPPSSVKLKDFEYLSAVFNQMYFESPASSATELQEKFRILITNLITPVRDDWIFDCQKVLKEMSNNLYNSLIAIMSDSCTGNFTTWTPENCEITLPALFVPSKKVNNFTPIMKKKRNWYTLGLTTYSVKTGETYLISMKNFETQMNDMASDLLTTEYEQVEKQSTAHLKQVQKTMAAEFTKKIHKLHLDLDAIKNQRETMLKDEGSSIYLSDANSIASIAASRIDCEGLYVEFESLLHSSRAGSNVNSFVIKSDMLSRDGK